MNPVRKLFAAAFAAATLACPLAAQHGAHATPARPPLGPGADSCSAEAYYVMGVDQMEHDPRTAEAAFYWAERLRPGFAAAIYARRVALLMQMNEDRFMRYMEGQRSVSRAPDVLAIDSLELRALTLDPYLHDRFGITLLRRYWNAEMAEGARQNGRVPNPAESNEYIQSILNNRADPSARGYMAYAEGRFAEAEESMERAVQVGGRRRSRLRADLARIYFLAGDARRAAETMTAAIQDMHSSDARDLVYVYESKALLEQSVGAAQEQLGDRQAAREAYGRALQEDIAYYPAHVQLGRLSLAAGDTAAGIAELSLAAQAAPGDASVHYAYADVLAKAGKMPEAIPELEAAVKLEPYYAAPHLLLARIYDASGMRTEAVQHLGDFIARAAQTDGALAWARQRQAELQAALRAEQGGAR